MKRYMLELLLISTIMLVCLDVLCARWNLVQPETTVTALISALTVLISYVVRDQSVVNKHNGSTSTDAVVSDS